MSEPNSDTQEQVEIAGRTERAFTDVMRVRQDKGRADGADGLFIVETHIEADDDTEQTDYLVDAQQGRCECPDHEHRNSRCKHIRRVDFATGRKEIPRPVWDAVSTQPWFGATTEGQPTLADE
jgi:hypothetical protein